MKRTLFFSGFVALALFVSACGDSGGEASSSETTAAPTTAAPTTAAPTTEAPTTTAAPETTTTQAPETTTTAEPAPAIDLSGAEVAINWDALPSDPFFAPANEAAADPFFHIHTNPATDGFFFGLELFTTGYGAEWTGELGTFDISCDAPAASTGICPYLDTDGPGAEAAKGDDFAATGSITILQLDDAGYELIIHEVTFSDGTVIAEFALSG